MSNKIIALYLSLFLVSVILFFYGCSPGSDKSNESEIKKTKIIFLHHSTGENIWMGGKVRKKSRLESILKKLHLKSPERSAVAAWFDSYNRDNQKNYQITDRYFPAASPYGWKNYPYDYYNIWVKNAGDKPYKEEPTLEMLTPEYDVIIWKHCFPVSDILPDSAEPDINSEKKTPGNYKLQYEALKEKMHQFPDTKFIVWTGAALVKGATTEDKAKRAKEFFDWVRNSWDEPGDNIYLWDFYQLETEGGLYLKDEYAASETDSHPNASFSKRVYPLFCRRIVDVIETNGTKTKLTGEPL